MIETIKNVFGFLCWLPWYVDAYAISLLFYNSLQKKLHFTFKQLGSMAQQHNDTKSSNDSFNVEVQEEALSEIARMSVLKMFLVIGVFVIMSIFGIFTLIWLIQKLYICYKLVDVK